MIVGLRKKQRPCGFTLMEVMIAILFISIAFFGYAALHERIILSGWKTELRATVRESARSKLAKSISSARSSDAAKDLDPVPESGASGLYIVRASVSERDEVKTHLTGIPTSLAYNFDTYVTARRVTTW